MALSSEVRSGFTKTGLESLLLLERMFEASVYLKNFTSTGLG